MNLKHFKTPFIFSVIRIFCFYLGLFLFLNFVLIPTVFSSYPYEKLSLLQTLIVLGNFYIAIGTQVLHHWLGNTDHYYLSFRNCFVRCLAGVMEMFSYTLFLSIGLSELIVGYLVLKTITVWNGPDDSTEDKTRPGEKQRKAGLSTAVLRLAIIVSILISIFAAHHLSLILSVMNVPTDFLKMI